MQAMQPSVPSGIFSLLLIFGWRLQQQLEQAWVDMEALSEALNSAWEACRQKVLRRKAFQDLPTYSLKG